MQTRNPRQTSNQIRHDLQTGMTRQVSTLDVLASSHQLEEIKTNNKIEITS